MIRSLHPKIKKTQHQVDVNCPDNLVLNLPAGAISQIFTNLIMNSLIHGFEGVEKGTITIDVSENDGLVDINYRDNGRGVDAEQLDKLFDPFFTTKRDQGGSGLGTHITFNLVKQTLGVRLKWAASRAKVCNTELLSQKTYQSRCKCLISKVTPAMMAPHLIRAHSSTEVKLCGLATLSVIALSKTSVTNKTILKKP